MTEFYVAITGTKGYFADIVKANNKEEAIAKTIERFAKVAGKVKKVFVKTAWQTHQQKKDKKRLDK